METLNQKLLKFQKTINVIKKDGKNPHFKNTYATLSGILGEVKPVLTDLGLILIQPVKDNKVITTIIDSESKDYISGDIDLPTGLTPQQIGSAITYYRRYLLAGMLSLEMEDDDGNTASDSKPDNREWLNDNTPQFTKAIEFLKSGKSINDIETKYKLSKSVREKLLTQSL